MLRCCTQYLFSIRKYFPKCRRDIHTILEKRREIFQFIARHAGKTAFKVCNLFRTLEFLPLDFPRKLLQQFTSCLTRCLRRSNDRLLCWHFWSGCARVLCEKTMLGTMCALPVRTEKNTHITLPYGRDA